MEYVIDFFDLTPISFWDSNFITLLIALLGVVISIGLTYCVNKRLNEQNLEEQNKMNSKNLICQIKLDRTSSLM